MDRKWTNHNPLRMNVFRLNKDMKQASGKIDLPETMDA